MIQKIAADDLAEFAEPFIDAASRDLLQTFAGQSLPELIQDIPFAKTAIAIGRVFNGTKELYRTRMMLAFLAGWHNGAKTVTEFNNLNEDEKIRLRGLVVAQLDMQTDERQAEAIGYVVDAYLRRDIDQNIFNGVVSEIKNTNPLLYYFDADIISVTKNDCGGYEATGAVELLPSVFGHNTVTGIGVWGSSGAYKFVLSKLGQAFFQNVYNPMLLKYQNKP